MALLLSLVWAEVATAGLPAETGASPLITLDAPRLPIDRFVADMRKRYGIRMRVEVAVDTPVYVSGQVLKLPLDQAMRRLLRGYSYVLERQSSDAYLIRIVGRSPDQIRALGEMVNALTLDRPASMPSLAEPQPSSADIQRWRQSDPARRPREFARGVHPDGFADFVPLKANAPVAKTRTYRVARHPDGFEDRIPVIDRDTEGARPAGDSTRHPDGFVEFRPVPAPPSGVP